MASVWDQLRTWGLIFYSPNYDSSTDAIPTPDATWSNHADIQSFIEATYTFDNIAFFQNFNANHAQEDEQETRFDDCSGAPSAISSRLTPSFNFDLFGVNNMSVMANLLWVNVQNVASAPVAWATQDVVNPSAFLMFIPIANQNFDGSAITVNSVTGSTDGALVAGTDYEVVTDENGVYGIQLISGWAITVLTQTFTINYDYTPAASEILSYSSVSRQKPFGLYKFVSCEDFYTEAGVAKTKVNTLYVSQAFLDSDYTENFVNTTNNELQPSATTLTGDQNSIYLHTKAVV